VRRFILFLSTPCPRDGFRATESTINFERFGTVHLYSSSSAPTQVALLYREMEDGTRVLVDMARELAKSDVLVAGHRHTHYLKELAGERRECAYPAADFEALSQFVQKSRGFPRT
jgi:type IV secretory pathway VirJ component